jgi:hypothetical protein
VHPASDFGREHLDKGIKTSSDSTLIEAPYENGEIGYFGLFIDYQPKGEHRISRSDGSIKFIINYDDNTL